VACEPEHDSEDEHACPIPEAAGACACHASGPAMANRVQVMQGYETINGGQHVEVWRCLQCDCAVVSAALAPGIARCRARADACRSHALVCADLAAGRRAFF